MSVTYTQHIIYLSNLHFTPISEFFQLFAYPFCQKIQKYFPFLRKISRPNVSKANYPQDAHRSKKFGRDTSIVSTCNVQRSEILLRDRTADASVTNG